MYEKQINKLTKHILCIIEPSLITNRQRDSTLFGQPVTLKSEQSSRHHQLNQIPNTKRDN